MRNYDPSLWTYGHELEIGDAPRYIHPPGELGAWEYSETCSINRRAPYAGIASDPLGLDPPAGGEINTVPTLGWRDQVDRVLKIVDFYRDQGHPPTISCVNDSHVHVHVPGLREDIEALKRIVSYIKANQHDAIRYVHRFEYQETMRGSPSAVRYLKLGGGTPMPDWMADNIVNKAQSFKDFYQLHCRGKAGDLKDRPVMPIRHAINLYCLKHINTIEFRIFRATLDRDQLESCYRFAEAFLDAALNGGPSVKEILGIRNREATLDIQGLLSGEGVGKESPDPSWNFPKLVWEPDIYSQWEATKWPKERGKKLRKFIEVPQGNL